MLGSLPKNVNENVSRRSSTRPITPRLPGPRSSLPVTHARTHGTPTHAFATYRTVSARAAVPCGAITHICANSIFEHVCASSGGLKHDLEMHTRLRGVITRAVVSRLRHHRGFSPASDRKGEGENSLTRCKAHTACLGESAGFPLAPQRPRTNARPKPFALSRT